MSDNIKTSAGEPTPENTDREKLLGMLRAEFESDSTDTKLIRRLNAELDKLEPCDDVDTDAAWERFVKLASESEPLYEPEDEIVRISEARTKKRKPLSKAFIAIAAAIALLVGVSAAANANGGIRAFLSIIIGVELDAPTVTAELSDKSVVLSWEAVPDATEYEIYRSTDGEDGEDFPILATVTDVSYTDTSLTPGSTYAYKVRAVKVSGSRADSGEFSAVQTVTVPKPPEPAPEPDSGLMAPKITVKVNNEMYTEHTIFISWKAISGAAKYRVYRSTDNESFERIITTSKTGFTDSDIISGTVYYYKVRAVSENDEAGAYSSVKSGMLPEAPKIYFDGENVKWDAVPGAVGYEVYICEDVMEGVTVLFKTTSSCSVKGKEGHGYGYKALAVYNVDGKTVKSPLSNPILT